MFQKSKYLLIGLVTCLIVATATFALSVTWDAANNAVVITSVTPLAVEERNVNSITMEAGKQEVKETTFKGLKAIEVDGKIYFGLTEWTDKMRKTGKEVKTTFSDNVFNVLIDEQNIFILKKDAILYREIVYIDSEYYID